MSPFLVDLKNNNKHKNSSDPSVYSFMVLVVILHSKVKY